MRHSKKSTVVFSFTSIRKFQFYPQFCKSCQLHTIISCDQVVFKGVTFKNKTMFSYHSNILYVYDILSSLRLKEWFNSLLPPRTHLLGTYKKHFSYFRMYIQMTLFRTV